MRPPTDFGPTRRHAAWVPPKQSADRFSHPMPDSSDRPPPLIPSHIAWPAFIVLLLALSVGAAVVTVIAARSDGGAKLLTEQAAP